MAERGPTIQSRGILTALRAAAVLVIVTGLSDVIAGAAPTFEPLYLYLAAVALITALDGVLLGLATAAAGTAFYALLFMPRAAALSTRGLWPAGAAFATAAVVAVIRGIVRRLRRSDKPAEVFPPAPSLLGPSAILANNTEVLSAIDELRADLRSAMTDAASAREREAMLERTYSQAREALLARLHVAEEEGARVMQLLAEERTQRSRSESAARDYAAGSERTLAAAREHANAMAARVAELEPTLKETQASARQRLEAARTEIDSLRGEIGRLRGAVEAARTEATARSAEIATLREAMEDLRRAREVERGRADGERGLRTTAVERVTELERALTAERAARAQAEQSRVDAAAARERVERALKSQETEASTLRVRIAELEEALATAAATESDDERELRARVAELEQSLIDERAMHAQDAGIVEQLEVARAETASLNTRVAGLQEELRRSSADAEARRREITALRGRIAELDQAFASERDARAQAVEQMEVRQTSVNALQAELLAVAQAAATRDGEAASLRERIEELEQELSSQHAIHEGELAQLAGEAQAAQAELERQAARVAQSRSELQAAHDALAGANAEAAAARDEKLRVEELLAAERAARTAETDAALGETRRLRGRVDALQEELARTAAAASEHSGTISELRGRLESAEQMLADERAARAAEVAESDRKIQLVTQHLAQDHEADLGVAVEEREAARAEARGLTIRVNSLQEEVRRAAAEAAAWKTRVQELEQAAAEERTNREQLQAETDARLNTIVAHLAEDHEADLGKALEEKEQARAEARSLGLRMVALQKKLEEQRQSLEHASELLTETRTAAQKEIDNLRRRLASAPALASAAVDHVRPRILIAHPDADLLMSARSSLERTGYEVTTAADGLEALRTAIALQPDVVIADATMPKMDGRELCQLLKSQEKTAQIRVILLMRATDDPPKGDFPPDEVLRKPVPLETLKATLAALLSSARRS